MNIINGMLYKMEITGDCFLPRHYIFFWAYYNSKVIFSLTLFWSLNYLLLAITICNGYTFLLIINGKVKSQQLEWCREVLKAKSISYCFSELNNHFQELLYRTCYSKVAKIWLEMFFFAEIVKNNNTIHFSEKILNFLLLCEYAIASVI